MSAPSTLGNLQQLLEALSWMRSHLPDYAKTAAPLQELLDAGLAKLPRRSRRYSDNVQLSWSNEHAEPFEALTQLLARAARRGHHDPGRARGVFTAASESHWAVARVRLPPEELNLTFDRWRRHTLAFLSGDFSGAANKW